MPNCHLPEPPFARPTLLQVCESKENLQGSVLAALTAFALSQFLLYQRNKISLLNMFFEWYAFGQLVFPHNILSYSFCPEKSTVQIR